MQIKAQALTCSWVGTSASNDGQVAQEGISACTVEAGMGQGTLQLHKGLDTWQVGMGQGTLQVGKGLDTWQVGKGQGTQVGTLVVAGRAACTADVEKTSFWSLYI